MKKVYTKPMLAIEKFELSQTIAQSCGRSGESSLGKPSHADKFDCGWDLGNLILWVGEPVCNKTIPEDQNINGFCYNNPNGGVTIFAS